MKEIGTISLERLNNGAHYLYMYNVLTRGKADAKIMEKAQLIPLITAFDAAVLQEDADLKISQKSLLTDEITAADDKRDVLYGNYKKIVKSYLDFPDTAMAQAAKVLYQHIKDFGIQPQMQLDKETGLLVNFISDLKTKYTEEIATLALTTFVEQLDAANTQVMSYTIERTEERMGSVAGALKASRAASDDAYRALIKMVNALALVEGDAEYVNFIDYVNTEIKHYKQEVLNGRSNASETTEEEAEEPTES